MIPLLCLLLLLAGFAVVSRALSRPLNHDEHQFLAPASLYLHHGLQPYRDFPLFHLPNLVYAYAAAEAASGNLILGGKLVSSLSTLGLISLLGWLAFQIPATDRTRILLAIGASLLLLTDPLYLFTAGKTWNHETPAFLLLAAVVFQLETFRRLPRAGPLLSGLFAGLAVGTRLTYLAPAGAFVLHFLLCGGTGNARVRQIATWAAGFGIALTPTAWCALSAPDAFVFDNFRFPRLRLLDPENTRIQKTMNWGRKLRYLAKEILPRSWPILMAAVLSFFTTRQSIGISRGTRLFYIILPFAVIGCFAPSRYQYQHFYILPVLLAAAALVLLTERKLKIRALYASVAAFCLVAAGLLGATPRAPGETNWREMGILAYIKPLSSLDSSEWFHNRFARQQAALQRYLPLRSPVLTLNPTAAIAGGMDFYPAFATGVFAWRSAEFVSAERRRALHYVAPADLESLYSSDLPAAILTGVEEPAQEEPLVQFAQRHGFRSVRLPRSETLWVLPDLPETEQAPPAKTTPVLKSSD